jgi:NitT/TauT family transport system ATP-binding protein
MLKAADHQRLERDVLLTALELEFPTDEAERQMETVANWGRYAEIFAYDDDDDVFFLELEGSKV